MPFKERKRDEVVRSSPWAAFKDSNGKYDALMGRRLIATTSGSSQSGCSVWVNERDAHAASRVKRRFVFMGFPDSGFLK
jgi:hypothetical protein